MTTSHLLILELTVLGAVITVYGLAAAALGAARQVRNEQKRIEMAERLSGWEKEERRAAVEVERTDPHAEERIAKYDTISTYLGLTRATYGNLQFLGAYEAARIAEMLLRGARFNLVVAGVGVLIGTAGAVWSIAIG